METEIINDPDILILRKIEDRLTIETYEICSDSAYSIRLTEIPQLNSLDVPNKSCPDCGSEIYYFGRKFKLKVYFDKIGSPWIRHICENTNHQNLTINSPKKNKLRDKIQILNQISVDDLYNRDGRILFTVKNEEYLLNAEFSFDTDLLLLIKKDSKFYLSTYNLSNHEIQEIPLLTKKEAEYETLRFFKIKNRDILRIKIQCCNLGLGEDFNYTVKLIDYNKSMIMNLNDFLKKNRNDIRLLRYVTNREFNLFFAIYINNTLKEISLK